jgi:DNA-binding GntR family transcriptional regulator
VANLNLESPNKIKRDLLADQATGELRRMIVQGALPPGGQVTERELSSLLGASRTPIREAVRALALEGLITLSSTGRYFVANPSEHELHDMLRVIGVLEGLAGRLACAVADANSLEAIARLQEDMRRIAEGQSHLDYFETNIAFHRAIVAASGNRVLFETHKALNDRLYRARYVCSTKATNRQRALEEHDAVVTALVARDGDGVERALRGHMGQAEKNISETLFPPSGN